MRLRFALVLFVCALTFIPATAQTAAVPDSPGASVANNSHPVVTEPVFPSPVMIGKPVTAPAVSPDPAAPVYPVIHARHSEPQTADRKYWTWIIAMNVATVFDMESTAHALSCCHVEEANTFLYGTHPSRARMYGINAPINAAVALITYHVKKSTCSRGSCRLWQVIPAAYTMAHGGAATANIARYH